MTEAQFAHGLKLIPRLDILKLEKLYRAFGSFEAVWNASSQEMEKKIRDSDLIYRTEVKLRLSEIFEERKNIDLKKEFQELEKQKIKILTLNDANYPELLRETPHPPVAFYHLGELQKIEHSVAIVGTRKATGYGLKIARDLGRDLSLNGICVVSGLALGIDAEAHKGALEGKTPTVAVLGSGLAEIYPSSHKFLAEKIIENNGAIISEYAPKNRPTKWTFPERNRIIASLSQAIIVVEAPKKSGALITSKFGLEYNREVGAVPGEIDSINSQGTNWLIKSGAAVIRNADDILELLGIEQKETAKFDNLEDDDILILNSLKEPKNAEELIILTKLSVSELSQRITLLELRGLIKNESGIIKQC